MLSNLQCVLMFTQNRKETTLKLIDFILITEQMMQAHCYQYMGLQTVKHIHQ
jgi:hypothetical protein